MPSHSSPDTEPPLDYRRAGRALRRGGWLIGALVALVAADAVALSMASATHYEATARIAEEPAPLIAGDQGASDRRLAASRVLVTAPSVLSAAAARIPGETGRSLAGKVSARADPATGILDVIATDTDRDRTSKIANVVAETYLVERRSAQRAVLDRAQRQLGEQIDRLGTGADAAPTAAALRQQLSELAAAEAIAGSELRLAEAATSPATPQDPHPVRAGLLGALAALVVGVLAALAYELVRKPAPDAATLALLAGLPLIGAIPDPPPARGRMLRAVVGRRPRLGDRRLIEQRAVESAVRQALAPRRRRVLLVHGVGPLSGAGRVAASLSRALDEQGFVIVQTPRVTSSEELEELASSATAVLLVARVGRAHEADMRAAGRLLDALQLPGLGLVLTGTEADLASAAMLPFEPPSLPPTRPRRAATNGTGLAARAPARF